LLLGLVPVVGGLFRLHHVVVADPSVENARFLVNPFPIILHISSATLYTLL